MKTSQRRLCIIAFFGAITYCIDPPDLLYFATVLGRLLQADEKLAKFQKTLADSEPAWRLLVPDTSVSNVLAQIHHIWREGATYKTQTISAFDQIARMESPHGPDLEASRCYGTV